MRILKSFMGDKFRSNLEMWYQPKLLSLDRPSYCSKGKGKIHPITGREGPEGGGKVKLCPFFNLDNRWEWVVNAMPLPLYTRKRNPVPVV
jgi:hypothetical protein